MDTDGEDRRIDGGNEESESASCEASQKWEAIVQMAEQTQ